MSIRFRLNQLEIGQLEALLDFKYIEYPPRSSKDKLVQSIIDSLRTDEINTAFEELERKMYSTRSSYKRRRSDSSPRHSASPRHFISPHPLRSPLRPSESLHRPYWVQEPLHFFRRDPIHPLTVSKWREIQSRSLDQIWTVVGEVLSDPDALGHSFLLPYPCDTSCPHYHSIPQAGTGALWEKQVDISSVRAMYQGLKFMDNQTYQNRLSNSLRKLLRDLPHYSSWELPHFSSTTHHSQVGNSPKKDYKQKPKKRHQGSSPDSCFSRSESSSSFSSTDRSLSHSQTVKASSDFLSDPISSSSASLSSSSASSTSSSASSVSSTIKFYSPNYSTALWESKMRNSFPVHLKSLSEAEATTLRCFIIILENPLFEIEPNALIFGELACALAKLPKSTLAVLSVWFSQYDEKDLQRLVTLFQSFITLTIFSTYMVGNSVESAVVMLKVLWDSFQLMRSRSTPSLIKREDFYNDAVNSMMDLKVDLDSALRENESEYYEDTFSGRGFSFCRYPFLLDPSAKSRLIHMDSIDQQQAVFEEAMIRSIFTLAPLTAYLVLHVKRDRLVQDTIAAIQAQSDDLRKPLRVVFEGEQGVDAGGVRKEFFQLLVRELLDPAYGMFTLDEDTRNYWFNPSTITQDQLFKSQITLSSFELKETEKQRILQEYELVGTILGLAIYNMVILDVHFPLVIYKKLLGIPTSYDDLKAAFPLICNGLQRLLEYDGQDLEDVFSTTFSVQQPAFGRILNVDLKPNGENIYVNQSNREEFVELYTSYLLSESIRHQFEAFRKGFERLCNSPALSKLFSPEDLELLICGNPKLDFTQLESNTKYQGFDIPIGRKRPTEPVINNFWPLVHQMDIQQKKKLLFFVTGSDRAPIKGLQDLKFIIRSGGTNEDTLPTSHTCFNTLILPLYRSAENLKKKLLIAIDYSQGFGLR